MPVALCIHCGETKNAPLDACSACRHVPAGDEDIARHTLMAEPYFAPDDLRAAAEEIRAGTTLEFDPAQVAELIRLRRMNRWRRIRVRGITLLFLAFITAILAVAAAQVFLPMLRE